MPPYPWTRFSAIKERPQLGGPIAEPLLPTSLHSDVRLMGLKAPPGDHYALGRIQGLPDRIIQTTTNQWPLVACMPVGAGDRQSCVMGFAVADVFVEARWNSPGDSDLDQRQVWEIATAVDRAVRSRVTSIRK